MVFVLGLAIYLFARLIRSRRKNNVLKTVSAEIVRIEQSARGSHDGKKDHKNKYTVTFSAEDDQTLDFLVDESDLEVLDVGAKGMLTYKGKHFVGFDAESAEKDVSDNHE